MKVARAPHFVRRREAPKVAGQGHLPFRPHVREDFRETCAYCLLEEIWAAGAENFEVDHFRPQSLFPQLRASYYNLYWSCHVCNRLKRGQWPSRTMRESGIDFVDLCEDSFEKHFAVRRNGQ